MPSAYEEGDLVVMLNTGATGTIIAVDEEAGTPTYLVEYAPEPGDLAAVWVRAADLAPAD